MTSDELNKAISDTLDQIAQLSCAVDLPAERFAKEVTYWLNRLVEKVQIDLHPWYGPCDGFDNGECAECAFLKKLKWPEHIPMIKAMVGE